MFNRPGLFRVWLTGMTAGLCLVSAYLLDNLWSSLLLIAALVNGGVSVMYAIDFIAYRWTETQAHLFDVRANTERVRLIHMLGLLNEGQLDALMHAGDIRAVLDGVEPEYIKLNDTEIPRTWAKHFTEDEYVLPAIRDYHDGTHERLWAKEITNRLAFEGWITPAAGNVRATWKSDAHRRRALSALGLEEG